MLFGPNRKHPIVGASPAQILEQAGLAGKRIKRLPSGDDSDPYLCAGRYVLKLPRRASVVDSQRREFELYRFLERETLPCEIPKAVRRGENYILITHLGGEALSPRDYSRLSEQEKDRLARDEARFLRALHAVQTPAELPLFSAVRQDKKTDFSGDRQALIRILVSKGLLTPKINGTIEEIHQRILNSSLLLCYSSCLIHNDFSRSNLVFRDKRLYGVIDFGDFRISDPDNDFLCLLDGSSDDFGVEFGRRVLKFYDHPDPNAVLRKAAFYNAYWPIQQILLGTERNDTKMARRGLTTLFHMDLDDFLI